MKNYWLDRWTEPIINQDKSRTQFDGHLLLSGQWYVTKQLKSEVAELMWDDMWDGCQMASGPDTYYLHSDGTWYRNSTLKDGEWTGYYHTKEEAEAVLRENS